MARRFNMELNIIAFDNEIKVWWQRGEGKAPCFITAYLNGEPIGKTEKTHFTYSGLESNTNYTVKIEGVGEAVVKTQKKKRRIDVTRPPYNAVGDGKTLNTEALERAFLDCGIDECVYFPAGVYMTGALTGHSDMEIYLEKGAVLQGTAEVEDYLPKIKSRFEGVERECYRSLLNFGELDRNSGPNCKNVTLRGGGEIRGGGKELCWATVEKERILLKDYLEQNADYIKTCENNDTVPGRARGRLLNLSNCDGVILSDISFGNGPAWNLHFIYSKNIVTCGCKIESHGIFNGDGWDPDSSENCVVFDTVFDTSDDCVAIKSGKNPEGNIVNKPTKNIYIFDCHIVDGHGISIGSEMSGGVENVYVWDCDMRKCWYGLQVKGTKKRGGYVRNIHVKDSKVSCLMVWSVLYNDDGEGAPHPPVFSDYHFENLEIIGRKYGEEMRYIYLYGFDEDGYEVKNVYLKNITLEGIDKDNAISAKYTKDIFWAN
jgi:polygalacturonase